MPRVAAPLHDLPDVRADLQPVAGVVDVVGLQERGGALERCLLGLDTEQAQ